MVFHPFYFWKHFWSSLFSLITVSPFIHPLSISVKLRFFPSLLRELPSLPQRRKWFQSSSTNSEEQVDNNLCTWRTSKEVKLYWEDALQATALLTLLCIHSTSVIKSPYTESEKQEKEIIVIKMCVSFLQPETALVRNVNKSISEVHKKLLKTPKIWNTEKKPWKADKGLFIKCFFQFHMIFIQCLKSSILLCLCCV